MQETWVQSLGWEDPLEKGKATQSSVLAWKIPWTVTHQAPLSMGSLHKNTGVGCYALLQEIFPTRGSNPGLSHCRQILYPLSH